MVETKDFDPRAIATLTTGTMLLDDFSKVHEVAEFVLGRPIWTHEFPREAETLQRLILEQLPDMPTSIAGTWPLTAAAVVNRYGESVSLRKGTTERAVDPLTSLVEMMGGNHG